MTNVKKLSELNQGDLVRFKQRPVHLYDQIIYVGIIAIYLGKSNKYGISKSHFLSVIEKEIITEQDFILNLYEYEILASGI